MNLKLLKSVAAILVLTLVVSQPCVYAASIPSKTAKDQGLASRSTELIFARTLFATDRIAEALTAEGVSPDQIEALLAALSTSDLISLGENPAQIKSAGITMSRRMWVAAGIGAAVLIGGLALYNDDDEDTDDSDDGED